MPFTKQITCPVPHSTANSVVKNSLLHSIAYPLWPSPLCIVEAADCSSVTVIDCVQQALTLSLTILDCPQQVPPLTMKYDLQYLVNCTLDSRSIELLTDSVPQGFHLCKLRSLETFGQFLCRTFDVSWLEARHAGHAAHTNWRRCTASVVCLDVQSPALSAQERNSCCGDCKMCKGPAPK